MLIRWSLAHKKKVLLSGLPFLMITLLLFGQLGGGFFPEEDEGQFVITVKTPVGTGLEYINDRLLKAESIVKKYDDIESLFTVMGAGIESQAVNIGVIYVKLKSRNIRKMKQYDMIPKIRNDLKS